MSCIELEKAEFTAFIKTNEYADFHQTTMMYEHLLTMGNESYLLGYEREGKLVAATLLTAIGTREGRKSFSAPKGFIVDYADAALVREFTQALQLFCGQHGGFRLIIEPPLPLVERDIEGEIVEGGFDNRSLGDILLQAGFEQVDIGSQTKWLFCLDIKGKTKEELWKDFKQTTRNSISRTLKKYQLQIRTLTRSELSEFKALTADTAERRTFEDKSLAYYESMYDNYGEDVVFKLVELNCSSYLESLQHEVETGERKLGKLSDAPSNANKREQIATELKRNKQEIEEVKRLKAERGNVITLAGGMFILYGSEVVYLFSGSYDEYKKYFGPYALQWNMIGYAADNGYERYNFFGITDISNKQGEGYGVYLFKKGFNGVVVEMMDPYEIGCSGYYRLYKGLRSLKGKLKV